MTDFHALLDVYSRQTHSLRFWKWAFLLVGGLAGAGCMCIGLWMMGVGYSRFGPAVIPAWGGDWIYVGGSIMLAGLAASLWLTWIGAHGLEIYTDGLSFKAPAGRRFVVAWEDIAGIYYVQQRYRFFSNIADFGEIGLENGRRISLGKFAPPEKLAEVVTHLKAAAYPNLEPVQQMDLVAGDEILFGPLSLSRQGVRLNKHFYPWDQVEQFTVQSGYLSMNLQGKRRRMALSKIPNLEIALSLARQAEKMKYE